MTGSKEEVWMWTVEFHSRKGRAERTGLHPQIRGSQAFLPALLGVRRMTLLPRDQSSEFTRAICSLITSLIFWAEFPCSRTSSFSLSGVTLSSWDQYRSSHSSVVL